MFATHKAAATAVKFAVTAAALTAAFAIGLAGGADAGQNSAGEVICPADTHWSIQLGTCVRDDTF
ncbi:hypothetical protein [Catellatospora citrea]|uniref:Uncharacterized protein n=1 Tax=Catellatospora citrea TaxID=53366 RepID=A0A8J3K9I5_9ACTN|nr:hypothetical protein [Catellatospora citrea]RKE11149.1 hypothetical protein C8E86_6073 [Catellatospora citrea]GIF96614.1 hypothetical protein Cci01nite_17080 [Catellatospora citrea]